MTNDGDWTVVYPDAGDDAADIVVGERLERLQRLGKFELHFRRAETDEVYLERVVDADAILLGWDLPADVMRQCKNLKVVSFTGIGADKFVDMEVASEQGVTVCNCPGYSDNTVAEHALALTLAVARQIGSLERELRAGRWSPSMGVELRGKVLGLIGFGGIGQRFAALAKALGMRVVAWTRNPDDNRAQQHGVEFVALDDLLSSSDVVSLHLASNAQTAGFLDVSRIEKIKSDAILINTARGEVVDEQALAGALKSGALRGAGIDVFQQEPLPADHVFIGLDNVVITPHIGYATPEAEESLFDIGIDNIVQYANGTPINVVGGPGG